MKTKKEIQTMLSYHRRELVQIEKYTEPGNCQWRQCKAVIDTLEYILED